VAWGNGRVSAENKIASFKDANIKNCRFFFDLLRSIEPRAINPDLIMEGDSDEALE
jgi:hypothetical protein